jgi:hypothetical protein
LAFVYEVQKTSVHRNALVFVLTAKQLQKLFRLSKHPRWYNSDISTHHSVRLVCVPQNSDGCVNKNGDEFTRDSSAQQFAGPEPTLVISGQNIMHKIMGWLLN